MDLTLTRDAGNGDLHSMPPELDIRPLERFAMYASLDLVSVMEPETDVLMHELAERSHREDEYDSPHKRPWFVSYHGCLAGETEVVTRQGIKPIRQLVGRQELLVPQANRFSGLEREGRGQKTRSYTSGGFKEVQVSSYGVQELYEVKLRRGRQHKVLRVTAAHRWMLKSTEMIETLKLRSGDRLKGIRCRRTGTIQMVPFAVAQGFVFGDGTARRGARDAAWLDLHHNGKDESMMDFFHGHKTRLIEREGRMTCTQIQGLPRTWKQSPSFDESSPFLLSWLAGYFAADGSVSKKGQATLVSASREAIDCARSVMSICGIGYGAVTEDVQSGTYPHGATYEDKTMYSVSFNIRDLPVWFFVLPKHRDRVADQLVKKAGHRLEWEVSSVQPLGISEEVFCATVPDVGCFALSDELLTGNSEFPGDAANACARYLNYRMMNFPATDYMPPWVTTTGTLGKAGELDIVQAWFQGGRALAIPEDDAEEAKRYKLAAEAYRAGDIERAEHLIEMAGIHQLGFVDEDHWMTVSTDLPVLPKFSRRPHIVEIKGKAHDVLGEMIRGVELLKPDGTRELSLRGPDKKHEVQLKATIGKAHDYDWGEVTVCSKCWFILRSDVYERLGLPGGVHPRSDGFHYCPRCQDYPSPHEMETFQLERPIAGEIYYWSRSWPRGRRAGSTFEPGTKSFYRELDPKFMAQGLAVLAEARQAYIDDVIPPRPAHFQWAMGACKNCSFKKFCRADDGVPGRKKKPDPAIVRTKLSESHGVTHTREMRPHYNPQKVRERVFAEWSDTDG